MKLLLTFALLCAIGTAMAQERAAHGTMETQMTWSALSDKINAANAKADGANQRVDQLVICGKKGLLYAPGQTGADAQGCLAANIVPPPSKPAAYKVQTTSFTGGLPFRTTPNDYCISKGYDAMSGSTSSSSERHYGGSTGGTETITTVTYYCVRVVPR